jgi:hypothetical protein
MKSRNEKIRVAAAAILLDRGYGRAPAAVSAEGQAPLVLLHLAAARALSSELQAELGAQPAAAPAEPQPQAPTIDLLLSAPPPTE